MERIKIFKDSHTMVEAIRAVIGKVEPYHFPKDGDPKQDEACNTL